MSSESNISVSTCFLLLSIFVLSSDPLPRMHPVRSVHLQLLLLWRLRVDDSYPPGFSGQQSHLVALILPPGLAKVVGPIGAGAGRGDVHEAPPGGVVPHTVTQWFHMFQDLRTEDRHMQVNPAEKITKYFYSSLTRVFVCSDTLYFCYETSRGDDAYAFKYVCCLQGHIWLCMYSFFFVWL